MYQALYRKWRPRTFDDVAGQEHITDTLKNQVRTDRLSHAYLFIGTRGTGKTTCAKILARAVNCENPKDGNPCNECKACTGIESGAILDVVELDAASNNGVDNVRALRDEAVFSPAYVKRRVYIIDEVHMLSTAAFNALLKILEEPPKHLMFILATTELHKVPATILSRCQRHSFKRLDSRIISQRLEFVAKQENLSLTADASELLGRLADGAMRDGLTLLDQCSGREIIDSEVVLQSIGLVGSRRIAELLGAIIHCDTDRALELFHSLWQDGKEPSTVLDELCTLERDILMVAVAPRGGRELLSGGYDAATLKRFTGEISVGELMKGMNTLREAMVDLRSCPSPRTAAELCIIEMCTPEPGQPLRQMSVEAVSYQNSAAISPVPETDKSRKEAVLPEPSIENDEPEEEEYVFEEEPEQDDNPFVPADMPIFDEPELASKPLASEPPKDEEAKPEPVKEALPENREIWSEILKLLSTKLSPGNYAVISDSFHGEGVLEGDNLVIGAKSAFSKNMFSSGEVSEAIKAAAMELLGRPVPVKIVNGGDKSSEETGKLDAFAQFGDLIKFE